MAPSAAAATPSTQSAILRETMAESPLLSLPEMEIVFRRRNEKTVEERYFCAALITAEGYFERLPACGPRARAQGKKMIGVTLEKTLNVTEVREAIAKCPDVWMRMRRVLVLAIPRLVSCSLVRESYAAPEQQGGIEAPETAALLLRHYNTIVEDLSWLNVLMVISRNLLAVKEAAQDICAAVQFDKAVHKLIILCVNVTSKGYDGENVDDAGRAKLNEVSELFKKLLVTCLQHSHNYTMGNDRAKMSFWFEMFFDCDLHNDIVHGIPSDGLDVAKFHEEVQHWLQRNNSINPVAQAILERYSADVELGHTPGPLPEPFWKPQAIPAAKNGSDNAPALSASDSKAEQDRVYGRVSHQIDLWWKEVRDVNYNSWQVPMASIDHAKARIEETKAISMQRYSTRPRQAVYPDEHHDAQQDDLNGAYDADNQSMEAELGEELDEEEEDEDDDDSYVEGPLRGLLTEIPNILDTKQIEALHMTIKACIVDSMGSGLTALGENLQKTRCKMFLALDCGKNLLRELLVFIAVWEQNESQFIFQITAQIIEAFHHNALLPFVWNALKIVKDIVSPAQTVLLRLVSYMFRARRESPVYDDTRDFQRDAKLVFFLYNYFRLSVVPDCVALIHAQARIRHNLAHPDEFPVDLWDMERAKDGLAQYLELISVVAEVAEMRPLLVQWEVVFELVTLLKALDEGVARKPFDETSVKSAPQPNPGDEQGANGHSSSMLSPLQDMPHLFPWTGVKNQILIIFTSLLAPNNKLRNGRGNSDVQAQVLKFDGVLSVLQCTSFDGNNQYLKERSTLAIKYMLDGCKEAQDIFRSLVPLKPPAADQGSRGQVGPEGNSSDAATLRRQRVSSEPTAATSQSDPASSPAAPHVSGAASSQQLAKDLAKKMQQLKDQPDSTDVLTEVTQLTKKFKEQLDGFR